MFRPTRPAAHRGTILIVTMLLLSLFAIIGITIVFYAQTQAERARITGEALGQDSAFPDDGRNALNTFMSSFIYGVPNNGQGLVNAIRDQDLMTLQYGGNGGVPGATTAFNGIGTFTETTAIGVDRRQMVNFRLFPGMAVMYDGEYSNPNGRAPTAGPSGTYIPKNAPYTYPDHNNFFLALVSPTGEVLVQSYHRQAVFGSLDPTNPNWAAANTAGKFLTPRPRPADHAGFPPVPPNPDGSYTGDVQNLVGGVGVQKNDSIWIDIGLPPITLPNGKRVKPLVAALIVDLDGRLNLSVHGNRMLPTGLPSPNDFAHTSGAGLGPWEVSLEKALGAANVAEARNLLLNRATGGIQSRGSTTKSFASRFPTPLMQLPGYSSVPWTGNGGASLTSLLLPGNGGNPMFATAPAYNPTYAPGSPFTPGYDSTNNPVNFHPALFNPSEWPLTANGALPRAFSLADGKMLNSAIARSPAFYTPMEVGNFAPTSLRGSPGTYPLPIPYPPAATTQNGYRLDPAHVNRALFTTLANNLDRSGLMASQTQLATGQAQSPYAALGPIDMNRPLADYRINPALPLDSTNMAPASVTVGSQIVRAAEADRQRFAHDIFARLIVVTGMADGPTPKASVDAAGNITIAITPATDPTGFNNLRALAQMAANMVDYIDADDISTAFVWNPANPADPFNTANFTPAAPDVLGNHVVFGVEKPRLVINEAYAEMTNDPNDPTFGGGSPPAKNAPHIRFWLELQNPTSPAYGLTGAGPLGTGATAGSVTLVTATSNPYQILITRNFKNPTAPLTDRFRNQASPTYDPSNVTGSLPTTMAADVTFSFSPAIGNAALSVINPANGVPGNGMVICASDVPKPPTNGPDYSPTALPAAVPLIKANPIGQPDALSYNNNGTIALKNAFDPINGPGEHVVLLRRLANPYLPGPTATNPYITVDMLDRVRTADRILRADGDKKDRQARTTVGGTGFEPNTPPAKAGDPDLRPQSIGKVQPYTAYTDLTKTDPTLLAFPASLALPQNPTMYAGTGPDGVRQTLGLPNSLTATGPLTPTYTPGTGALLGGETLMTPYDWFVHLDRPLINQLELLHVTAVKPYEWALWSDVPNAARTDVVKFAGSLQNLIVNPAGAPTPFSVATVYQPTAFAQLYQAFDLLRIQPYGQQTPLGGRIPGRININTITDKRVWDALFDAQVASNLFTQAQVDQMWNTLMASRTVNMVAKFDASGAQLKDAAGLTYSTPVPGATVYDNISTAGDRPFLPFGAGTVPVVPGGTPIGATAKVFGGGTGIDDTLLRRDPTTGMPYIYNTAAGVTHPYQQAEAARKILNNTTTVSHTFAVWVTVGYFEVASETSLGAGLPTDVKLGREYFQSVPGDTRNKFFAIVDRTNIGLDPANFQANNFIHATTRPFFTTLEPLNATANQYAIPAGSTQINIYAPNTSGQAAVYSDGVAVPITPGTVLAIGSGAVDREVVTVTAVGATVNGVTTVTVSALTKNHDAGACVSNIVPGNPGPQANFDVSTYPWIVQHWSRLP